MPLVRDRGCAYRFPTHSGPFSLGSLHKYATPAAHFRSYRPVRRGVAAFATTSSLISHPRACLEVSVNHGLVVSTYECSYRTCCSWLTVPSSPTIESPDHSIRTSPQESIGATSSIVACVLRGRRLECANSRVCESKSDVQETVWSASLRWRSERAMNTGASLQTVRRQNGAVLL